MVEFLGEPGSSVTETERKSEEAESGNDGEDAGSLQPIAPVETVVPSFDLSEAITRCFGKHEFFLEMVEGFFVEVDPMLREMQEFCRSGMADKVRESAHRLKNTVIYLGARPAAAAIGEVERAAKAGEFAALGNALDALKQKLELLKSALAEHRRLDTLRNR